MHPPGRASALAGCRSPLTVGTGIVIGVLGRPAAKQPGRRRSQHLPLHAAGDRARQQPRAWSPETAARLPMFPARASWCAASRPTPATTVAQGITGRPPRCSGFQTAPASVTSQTTECGLSASREATPNACSRARSRARRSRPTATRLRCGSPPPARDAERRRCGSGHRSRRPRRPRESVRRQPGAVAQPPGLVAATASASPTLGSHRSRSVDRANRE